MLDDQRECTDKGNSSKKVETEQVRKEDSRMQSTITNVSNDKHVGFINEELFVHREAFGKMVRPLGSRHKSNIFSGMESTTGKATGSQH